MLERTLQAVEKGRERLQVVIEPEPEPESEMEGEMEPEMEELPGSIEVEAELEETFFDQDAR